MKKLKIHKGGVRCVEYSLDGGIIITGGKDKTIKVSNIVKGTGVPRNMAVASSA